MLSGMRQAGGVAGNSDTTALWLRSWAIPIWFGFWKMSRLTETRRPRASFHTFSNICDGIRNFVEKKYREIRTNPDSQHERNRWLYPDETNRTLNREMWKTNAMVKSFERGASPFMRWALSPFLLLFSVVFFFPLVETIDDQNTVGAVVCFAVILLCLFGILALWGVPAHGAGRGGSHRRGIRLVYDRPIRGELRGLLGFRRATLGCVPSQFHPWFHCLRFTLPHFCHVWTFHDSQRDGRSRMAR